MRFLFFIIVAIVCFQSCRSDDLDSIYEEMGIQENGNINHAKRVYHDDWELILNENIRGIQQLVRQQAVGVFLQSIDSTDTRIVKVQFMNQAVPIIFYRNYTDEDLAFPSLSIAPDNKDYYWMLNNQFILDANSHKIKVSDESITPFFQHLNGQWLCQLGDYKIPMEECQLSPDLLSISEDVEDFATVSFANSCQMFFAKNTFALPQVPQESFYKDLFLDAGIGLTSWKSLYAADYLGLSSEGVCFSRTDYTAEEQNMQDRIFSGDEKDSNGRLLYPDGQPRYKLLFVCGGNSRAHGASMNDVALQNMRNFIHHGGSYVGTCAGAFFASNGYDGNIDYPYYLSIMPSMMQHTGLSNVRTGMFVEKDSPLLTYYDFGGDHYISEIRHNKGGYPVGIFDGMEVLARYDYPDKADVHLQPSIWAYKPKAKVGRIVIEGSHPEEASSGERLDLTAAMMQYAIDGIGLTDLKGFLQNGLARNMYMGSEESNPSYTKIGDLQTHHFAVMIPKGASDISLYLDSNVDCDLVLRICHETYAYPECSTYSSPNQGSHQQLKFENIAAGVWYVSVQCLNTVEATETDFGQTYVDKIGVLNGIPYQILMKWKTKTTENGKKS